ncbi:OmpH family outer membrane protein [Sphingobacterium alkalisoli]|uniref:OmpH family outer membrane protein n=1 Tax=Sphingobacterium alkalisoli TaxID=1874115 RepID=A0A4U0H7R8_9SPHI|nr:OmpH family outer membrane protein [Sphingobacterium alkalisoli]TJY66432.1 OmpH family outer membrane protein [Sphingobacterium alkalisoli]
MNNKLINPKVIWRLAVLIGFILLMNVWMLFFKKSEIVYVDAGRILQEYKGAAVARESFEKKAQQWKSNIDTLQKEFDEAYRKFEREEKTLSPALKEGQREVLKKQQKSLEDYKMAIEQNAVTENNKLSQETISKVNKFLTEYGKKHKYRFILIANQVGTIAYAEEGTDKTDEVLEELNKEN